MKNHLPPQSQKNLRASCDHPIAEIEFNGTIATVRCKKCSAVLTTSEKRHKYGVSPAHERRVDGKLFHSKKEAKRYADLLILLEVGAITDLVLQPRFKWDRFCRRPGTEREYRDTETYVGDFQYKCGGVDIVEDVKGAQTREFRRKMKIFIELYPELKLLIT